MAFPFKAVAFDMDGTFLRDDKTFDRKLFSRLLDQMLAQGVHVVVASGDQYECLLKYFPACHEQLTFISENGAHIIDHDTELVVQTMDPAVVDELIPFMVDKMNLVPSLSGHEHGYISPNVSASRLKRLQFYFPNHVFIEDFKQLPADRFYQISFVVEPAKLKMQLQTLRSRFGERLKITPSGNGSVDLTIPGVDKAQALQTMLAKWHLTADDLVAFGDGGNDVTMLKMARIGWAMQNASATVKQAADFTADEDNNHDAVLHVLQSYL
ncbi:Cof-type HAD-IIB family hydrolase [Limosilactobacillus mucosae]|uniref:Cof-type HAD-IIB family hydrolase n=1 Tax=Limosilactobacillus mucosae TaxID=97478 RepID=UPI0022E84E75|nr:Cof-type HAD-IIB family hydrolase [Limosilactobacillus mucosae]